MNAPTHAPSWGSETFDLVFGGMHFRIEGLTADQGQSVFQRFKPLAAYRAQASRSYTTIRTAQMAFDEPDVMRYTDLNCGYSPLITETSDGVWVEGLNFRGKIQLHPNMRGTLYTSEPSNLADPTVFENFLRLYTAYAVLRQGGVLLHSAGVVVNNRAWLFIGSSGAGKSSIAKLALAAGADILSDDINILLPNDEGGFNAGPVPFAGDLGQVACNKRGTSPVAATICLRQSSAMRLRAMQKSAAYSRLMTCSPTVNISHTHNDRLHDVLIDLLQVAPSFELNFSLQDEFDDIYRMMREEVPAA